MKPPKKEVVAVEESKTGRNTRFYDTAQKKEMSRDTFVKEIEAGNYPGYHIRDINGIKTPCSNPDNQTNNNLG